MLAKISNRLVSALQKAQTSQTVHVQFIQRAQMSQDSYTARQIKLGRPVSPHVTIYKFPIAAISSISNRFTGLALSIGVTGIGVTSLVGIDPSIIMTTLGSIPFVSNIFKFSVSFPLIYHYLGGVRHVIWDYVPENLINNEKVEQSSYALIGVSSVTAIAAAFVSF